MKLEISDSVENLINRVEEETGKPVKWVQSGGMPSMVEVRPARKKDPEHIIYIAENFKDPQGQHLIACKGYQILRIFSEKVEDRLVPSAGQDHLNNARMRLALDTAERPDLAKALNEEEIVKSWIFGVVNQLISQPADLHIQKAVRENHPDLRDAQDMVLEEQFRVFQASLGEGVRQFSPKTIYNASLFMNGVYLHLLDRQIGSSFISRLSPLPRSKKIEKLLEASLVIWEDSPAGDRKMTDTWADFLQIRDWYEWILFES